VALAPQVQVVYLLSERLSPYVSVAPKFGCILGGTVAGQPVSLSPDSLFFLRFDAYIGVNLWIPRDERAANRDEQ
jgi:hypothetical protein